MEKNPIRRTPWLLLVVTGFMVVYFLFADFDIRYMYVYFMLGVLLCVNVGLSGIKKLVLSPYKKLFICLAAVCAAFSVLPQADLSHLSMSLTISMLTFTAYFMFMEPGESQIELSFCVVQTAGVVFALYVLFVQIWPDFYWDNIYPCLAPSVQETATTFMPQGYGVPIGGSTIYASYVLTLGLIINLSRALKPGMIRSKKQWAFVAITSALYFTAIMTINRRTELIAMACTMAVLFVCSLLSKNEKNLKAKFLGLGVVLAAAAVISFVLAETGFMDRHMNTLESIGQIGEEGVANDITSGRLALWIKAIQLFLQKPVLGIGWQQFAAQDKYNHNVHNTYLQWLCETGIVGFVLIFVPIFVMALLTLQQAYKLSCQRADAKIRMINFVSLGMQAFLAICNLVDPAFYHLNYFCFYSFTMILAHYAYHTGKQELQLLNKENEQ